MLLFLATHDAIAGERTAEKGLFLDVAKSRGRPASLPASLVHLRALTAEEVVVALPIFCLPFLVLLLVLHSSPVSIHQSLRR